VTADHRARPLSKNQRLSALFWGGLYIVRRGCSADSVFLGQDQAVYRVRRPSWPKQTTHRRTIVAHRFAASPCSPVLVGAISSFSLFVGVAHGDCDFDAGGGTTAQYIECLAPRAEPDPRATTLHAGPEPDDGRPTQAARAEGIQAIRIEPKKRPPKVEPRRLSLRLEFDFGSSSIPRTSVAPLIDLARAMRSDALSEYVFLVEGHTDAVGSHAANQRLSEQRAAAVRDFLASAGGVNPARLGVIGRGEEQLLDTQNPSSGRNRRVEIVLVGGGG
jgi:outer membrane protein OmpA-like peptidoglycan-associated protein